MRKRKLDWASVFPLIVVSVIALIVLESIIGMLNTEGWNPLVKMFATVGVPIAIVAMVMMRLIAGFASDKDDGAPTITNPIISLVRRLRGKKGLTPEQLATIYNEKTTKDVFNNEDYRDSVDEVTGAKTGRPMNPIILLVRRLRKGE